MLSSCSRSVATRLIASRNNALLRRPAARGGPNWFRFLSSQQDGRPSRHHGGEERRKRSPPRQPQREGRPDSRPQAGGYRERRGSYNDDDRRPRSPPPPRGSRPPPPPPQSNVRTQFEENHHLEQQLSRFKISEEQQAKWERMVRRDFDKPPQFQIPPHQVSGPAPYEFDALEEVHNKSYSSNVLLEVRDVRVPASSHHPSFTRLAKHRLHLICYTHADMIDAATRDRVEKWTQKSWPDSKSIFVDVRENRPIYADGKSKKERQKEQKENKDEVETQETPEGVWDLVYDSLLKHLEEKGGNNVALTVGVANTGKSSLLMALMKTARNRGELPKGKTRARTPSYVNRKGKRVKARMVKAGPAAIEDRPGKTRELTEYLLREKPRTFFLDVPGVTPPSFFLEERPESWYALAATNLLPPNAINLRTPDPDTFTAICDYVLRCLNRDGCFGYVRKFDLKEPTDDVQVLLETLNNKYAHKIDARKLQLRRCETFLKLLNTGNLGSVILDDLTYPHKKFEFKEHHFKKKNRNPRDRDERY